MTSQALNRPVDVLAKIRAACDSDALPYEVYCAVAELVEAANLGGDMPKRDGSQHAGMFFTAANAARLRTAIAAVEGKA